MVATVKELLISWGRGWATRGKRETHRAQTAPGLWVPELLLLVPWGPGDDGDRFGLGMSV